jgi:hypothetical protein
VSEYLRAPLRGPIIRGKLGMSEATLYVWKKRYAGGVAELRRMRHAAVSV